MTKCIAPGCESTKLIARSMCTIHYHRWWRWGDFELRPKGFLAKFQTSGAVHAWLKNNIGPAKNFPCVDCKAPATDWSYSNDCPDERVEVIRRKGKNPHIKKFCPHPEHYATRCKKCHDTKDTDRRVHHGEAHGRAKLTASDVRSARNRVKAGETIAQLAHEHNVNWSTMADAVRGVTWKHVD